MDSLAFRIANRLVGNAESAAAIEMTTIGACLRFDAEAVLALTGADMDATLDGARVPVWSSVQARAGSILRMGAISGAGTRTYLAIPAASKCRGSWAAEGPSCWAASAGTAAELFARGM